MRTDVHKKVTECKVKVQVMFAECTQNGPFRLVLGMGQIFRVSGQFRAT